MKNQQRRRSSPEIDDPTEYDVVIKKNLKTFIKDYIEEITDLLIKRKIFARSC